MNKTIELLLEQKEKYDTEIKNLQFLFSETEGSLRRVMYEETCLLNKVLKNNVVDIINMIHKHNLKCSSIKNTEIIYGNTVYTVSDGCYYMEFMAQDGTIVSNAIGIQNGDYNKDLHLKVDCLICNLIIPYCEANKHKYLK